MFNKHAARRLGLSAACTVVFAAGCASLPRNLAEGVVNTWQIPSAEQARHLIDEYGVPDDVTLSRLTWNHPGQWKRITVWNRKPIYLAPVDLAVMEQTVDYRLTPEQAATLLYFSDRLAIDLDRGELSIRTNREDVNYLTLNLSDEILRGVKTLPEARTAFIRQYELSAAGKSAPAMKGLLFAPGP